MQEFKEFFTPEEVDVWASNNYPQIVLEHFDLNKQAPLSPLSLYTGSMSHRINTALRRGALSDDFSHFQGLQYDLCQYALPENITVWRYITFQELLFWWRATAFKRTYINPAFVSTTLLLHAFNGQARESGFVIRIDAPKGTPCAYITELESAAIAEYEVLFAHHLAFKRTGKRSYEIIPELPAEKYRGEYVDHDDFYQP